MRYLAAIELVMRYLSVPMIWELMAEVEITSLTVMRNHSER